MKYNYLLAILDSDKDTRRDEIENLINCDRNKKLLVHERYYDGDDWDFDDSQQANSTASGKIVWGSKGDTIIAENDKLGRNPISTGNVIKFQRGQLQVRNYIKMIIHTYQDFIVGDSNANVTITAPDDLKDKDSIQKSLDSMWKRVKPLMKKGTARLVLDTIAPMEVSFNNIKNDYTIKIPKTRRYFPIYDGDDNPVGSVIAYNISKREAQLMYGVAMSKDDNRDTVSYAEIYVPFYGAITEDGEEVKVQYYFYRLVDGIMVNEPLPLPEDINFDPICFVPNFDHANNDFNEETLEDSEIFDLIDLSDSLNSNCTIEFVTNQYLAMPKVSIDTEVAQKLNVNLQSEEFKQALQHFQYFPGSIDSLPIKIASGQSVPDSFYKGKDDIKEGFFEVSAVPKYMLNADSISNISAETLELGLSMLRRRIEQKRGQLILLIKEVSLKVLKAKGLVDPDLEVEDFKLIVKFPEITGIQLKDFLDTMFKLHTSGLISDDIAAEQILTAVDRNEVIKDAQNSRSNNKIDVENKVKLIMAMSNKQNELNNNQPNLNQNNNE